MSDWTDDELTAVWNACIEPAVDDWRGDEVAIMRCALDADTPEAMRRVLRGSGVGPDDVRNRLADELCRRFPLPITAAVLDECGFAPSDRVPLWDMMLARAAVTAEPLTEGWDIVWYAEGDHGELVTDARRLRELCKGLELVYGKRKEGT